MIGAGSRCSSGHAIKADSVRGCTFRHVAQAVGLAALGAVLAGCATTPAGDGATPSRGLAASPQPGARAATPTQLPTPTAQVAAATAPLPTSVATEAVEYTVQEGDTLLGLAANWGVPMAAIQRANSLGASTVLMVALMPRLSLLAIKACKFSPPEQLAMAWLVITT